MVAGLVGRKADAFAALLEGKAPVATDPNLAQLANIASRLSTVPQPTAAFRSALRDQLMATAGQSATTVAPHPAATHAPAHAPAHTPTVPAPRVSPTHAIGHGAGSTASSGSGLTSSFTSGLASLGKTAPVWAKVFAGVAAVSVSATGVAVGAHRALPGDLLYGVKQQVEAIQLDLASGAHEKAITEFGFAQARINELHELIRRDHVVAGQPVSKDTAAHLKSLLENWAENTGVATTSLIQQIQALGSSAATAKQSEALRQQLSSFTSQQFAAIGTLLGSMPTASLQSLTVSALGYLQRVDAVLGHDPADLIGKLPISLDSIPGVSKVLPRLVLPSTIPTTGGKVVLPQPGVLASSAPGVNGLLKSIAPGVLPNGISSIAPPSSGTKGAAPNPLPSAVQSVAGAVQSFGAALTSQVPAAVQSVAGAVTSQLPQAVQSVAGNVGKTATGAVTGVTGAVGGVLGAVTGGVTPTSGPSLPLPVSLPVLPTLPKLPGLH